jgi:hypothetical protein
LEALRATIGSEAGWHATLLRIEQQRCVLFTHDQTLFSFFVCRPERLTAEYSPERFGLGLFKAMLRSGFAQDQVETLLDRTRAIHIAKINSRRVLGTMNDMAYMLKWTIADRGGLATTNPNDLHRLLNETPFKAIDYDLPLNRMRELVAKSDDYRRAGPGTSATTCRSRSNR